MWWCGEGLEGDIWLNEEELEECKALDTWLAKGGEQRLEWEEDHEQEDRQEEENGPKLTIRIPPPRPHSSSEWGGV